MGNNTGIQWTDHTLNFWTGCKKVSPGCKYCYMYREAENRFHRDASLVTKVQDKTIKKVLREAKPGDRIFTCSWSDFFIEEADQWRGEAWKIMADHPHLTFQILTKRAERIHECIPMYGLPANVWIGVSVESQEYVSRIAYLADLDCVRFASVEPLIGEVVFDGFIKCLDWVILGGESGNEQGKFTYRTPSMEWILSVRDECRAAKVPLFVKQLGTGLAKAMRLKDRHGGDMAELPQSLQIREFPKESKLIIQ